MLISLRARRSGRRAFAAVGIAATLGVLGVTAAGLSTPVSSHAGRTTAIGAHPADTGWDGLAR
jgi:hypothetical protein